MTRCIVNVATGRFTAGQSRLLRAFPDETVLCWTNAYPPGSPEHLAMPYAFKAYALQHARDLGFDLVLWADACIVPHGSIETLWDRIENDGYWISNNGWKNGEWCSDAALPLIGITRDEAMTQKHVVATTFGLNLASDIGIGMLDEYLRLAKNGAFCGPWKNDQGQASSDPRVLGHRHDQSCLSAIAAKRGCSLTNPPFIFSYRGGETSETILVADGAY